MRTRIVYINDDEATQDLLTLGAKKAGWLLFSYAYAHLSLVPLGQIRPDLIILNFEPLLGGAGREFLQLLKMNDATVNIPIMVITTPSHLTREIQDYLLTRYIKVVHKPFDIDVFLELVRKTLTEASQTNLILSGDQTLPILIVDDEEDLRDSFATLLRLENYRVVTARNGHEAWTSYPRPISA